MISTEDCFSRGLNGPRGTSGLLVMKSCKTCGVADEESGEEVMENG